MAWGSESMGSFVDGTRDVLNEFSPKDQQFAEFILQQLGQQGQQILRASSPADSHVNALNNYFFTGQSNKAGTWDSIGTGNGTALLDTAKRLGWIDGPVNPQTGLSQAAMGHRLFQAGWGGENNSVLSNNGTNAQDILTAFLRTSGGGTQAPALSVGQPTGTAVPGATPSVPASGGGSTPPTQGTTLPGTPGSTVSGNSQDTLARQIAEAEIAQKWEALRQALQLQNYNIGSSFAQLAGNPRNFAQSAMMLGLDPRSMAMNSPFGQMMRSGNGESMPYQTTTPLGAPWENPDLRPGQKPDFVADGETFRPPESWQPPQEVPGGNQNAQDTAYLQGLGYTWDSASASWQRPYVADGRQAPINLLNGTQGLANWERNLAGQPQPDFFWSDASRGQPNPGQVYGQVQTPVNQQDPEEVRRWNAANPTRPIRSRDEGIYTAPEPIGGGGSGSQDWNSFAKSFTGANLPGRRTLFNINTRSQEIPLTGSLMSLAGRDPETEFANFFNYLPKGQAVGPTRFG